MPCRVLGNVVPAEGLTHVNPRKATLVHSSSPMELPAVKHVIDEDLLRRFDIPGPRYTPYPTADRFVEAFTERDDVQTLQQRRAGSLALPLSMHVHIPFCESLCYYRACNKVVTKHHERAAEYLRYLSRALERQTEHVGRGHRVTQLHLGGARRPSLATRSCPT